MTPEERELRRALDARSGELSAEFRTRISSVLSEGRPAPSALPLIALLAAATLTIATIGVLLVARHSQAPIRSGPASAARLTSPSPSPIPMPTTAQLSAPSSQVVWAFVADSVLYRSLDRGNTWEQRPLPPIRGGGYPEISFVDYDQGWYSTGGSPETQCNGEGTEIWHTTDGGATWQQIALVEWTQPASATSGIGYAQCKEGLSFIDPTHGFFAAWDDNHRPTIYRTSDGGRTWRGATLPDPPGFTTLGAGDTLRAGLVRAFGSTLLVPASGIQPGAHSEVEYVFRSSDGGTTWSYLASGNGINSVSFVTALRWLQLIVPDQSFETTDSGKTWHSYTTDYSQAAPIAPEIVFGDSLVGYATVRGGIQRTTDGGLHWTYIKTPGTQPPG